MSFFYAGQSFTIVQEPTYLALPAFNPIPKLGVELFANCCIKSPHGWATMAKSRQGQFQLYACDSEVQATRHVHGVHAVHAIHGVHPHGIHEHCSLHVLHVLHARKASWAHHQKNAWGTYSTVSHLSQASQLHVTLQLLTKIQPSSSSAFAPCRSLDLQPKKKGVWWCFQNLSISAKIQEGLEDCKSQNEQNGSKWSISIAISVALYGEEE